MTGETPVIQSENLKKTFALGLRRKKVEALKGVSFSVKQGEIFGFLGPNGAGKTTTIKIIVSLLRPTSGTCSLFGKKAGDIRARKDIGYLPESPYFYDHLMAEEFMDFCGRLKNLSKKERTRKGNELLERVGLGHALDRPLRKFSKGMLQRIGLAQTLLSDPKLLILDEPMTGLDPIGRKEIRDLIVEQARLGKTVFFSSHILSDVEMLCDRVTIINKGLVTHEGSLEELLEPGDRIVDIELENVSEELEGQLKSQAESSSREKNVLKLTVKGKNASDEAVKMAIEGNARLLSLIPQRETLEKLFF